MGENNTPTNLKGCGIKICVHAIIKAVDVLLLCNSLFWITDDKENTCYMSHDLPILKRFCSSIVALFVYKYLLSLMFKILENTFQMHKSRMRPL